MKWVLLLVLHLATIRDEVSASPPPHQPPPTSTPSPHPSAAPPSHTSHPSPIPSHAPDGNTPHTNGTGEAPGGGTHQGHHDDDSSHHGAEHGGVPCTCPLSAPSSSLECSLDTSHNTCIIQDLCHDEHHGDHGPPYAIFFMFISFALGALVRYSLSEPPWNKLPYTIVLFVLGVGIGFVTKAIGGKALLFTDIASINPHLIFFIFLPILIFESAFSLDWYVFKKVLGHCFILAGPGILLATGMTAVLVKGIFTTSGIGTYDWSWVTCFLFGAIVSATDPVAVVALLKELGAPAAISSLIEGESLFNDGTAIVLFNLLKASVPEGVFKMGILEAVKELLWVACGGPIVGLVMGLIGQWCLSKVFNDALIEITVTLCCAYFTFFLAEGFLHVSGVLALVVLGVWLSHHRQAISPEVEHTLHEFWEMTVYLTNTLIFMLVGLVAAQRGFAEAHPLDAAYLVAGYVVITAVRGFLLVLCFKPLEMMFKWKLEKKAAILVWWGGLRGAVGLALTLIVAGDVEIGCVHKSLGDQFLFHVVGIVAATLMLNGISTQFLVARLGLAKIPASQRRLLAKCFNNIVEFQHDTIKELQLSSVLSEANWQIVKRYTHEGMKNPYEEEEEDDEPFDVFEEARLAYLKIIRNSVWEQYEHGTISAATIPRVLGFLEKAKEKKGVFLSAELLVRYWNESTAASCVGGLALSLPHKAGYIVGDLAAKWKEERWAAGFDVANCLVRAHEDVMKKIDTVVEDRKVCNHIKTHCKQMRAQCFAQLQDLAAECIPIAVGIQTRHAARTILNGARGEIERMQHQGLMDSSDAAELTKVVEKKMGKLAKAKIHMPQSEVDDVLLEEVPWMQLVGSACMMEFKLNGHMYHVRKRKRLLDKENSGNGMYIVVSGVARVRVTRSKVALVGAGETLGLANVMCREPRFPEAHAETDMRVLWFTADFIFSLIEKYKQLGHELWKEAAYETAFMVLCTLKPYSEWTDSRLKKYCRSGTLVSAHSQPRPMTLHGGRHHILIDGFLGDEDTSKSARLGFQLVSGGKDEKKVMSPSCRILCIDDPTSAEAKARQRWAMIRDRLRAIQRDSLFNGREGIFLSIRQTFGTASDDILPLVVSPSGSPIAITHKPTGFPNEGAMAAARKIENALAQSFTGNASMASRGRTESSRRGSHRPSLHEPLISEVEMSELR